MSYYQKLRVGDKVCIVVHAGYIEDLDNVDSDFSTLEQFYLYAREESYQFGGKQNTVIIAGHTPTIAKGTFAYNNGNVLKYHNKEKNCIFYDIDCGCVFRNREPDAKLAFLCLDNEKIFYLFAIINHLESIMNSIAKANDEIKNYMDDISSIKTILDQTVSIAYELENDVNL